MTLLGADPAHADAAPCPCGSGAAYPDCCGAFHAAFLQRGVLGAPTAEALMRSRFTAFALGDAEHLRRTWHPSTRPVDLVLDDGIRWVRLDVLAHERGGPFDDEGIVEFEAFFRGGSGRGSMRERSRFMREDRLWRYVDGVGTSG